MASPQWCHSEQVGVVAAVDKNLALVTILHSEDASSMFLNKGSFYFCTIFLILLSLTPTIQSRPGKENGSPSQSIQGTSGQHRQLPSKRGTLATVNARIGSRPPSCVNKCDSCTPCQAVQAGQTLAEMSTNIGSRPPSCQNKCNRCIPCQAVQVPTPQDRKVPRPSQGDISVEYSNYKPEGWRCKCGNKLFNP